MIKGVGNMLKDKRLNLVVTEKAKEYIVDNGYDPVYGARPLRRFIQHSVETLLAKFILQGECKEGDTLTIDVKDGNLYIKNA